MCLPIVTFHKKSPLSSLRRCYSSSDAYAGMNGGDLNNPAAAAADSQSKLRRKLESEDSNYDSDHDRSPAGLAPPPGCGPFAGAGLSACHQQQQPVSVFSGGGGAATATGLPHGDVSRQTSETLAAEFSEYVTIQTNNPPQQHQLLESEPELVMDEDYKNKVGANLTPAYEPFFGRHLSVN